MGRERGSRGIRNFHVCLSVFLFVCQSVCLFDILLLTTRSIDIRVHRAGSQLKNRQTDMEISNSTWPPLSSHCAMQCHWLYKLKKYDEIPLMTFRNEQFKFPLGKNREKMYFARSLQGEVTANLSRCFNLPTVKVLKSRESLYESLTSQFKSFVLHFYLNSLFLLWHLFWFIFWG